MIGKIIKSKSFKNLIEYLDKKDAVVLGTNMYGRNNRELTAEFMSVHDLNPGIKQPVLHASLSLSPGESLSNEQFTQACETWIEKMGFDLASNQYLIVRHQDTEHEHAHIAINRIDMVSGLVVADHFDRYRSQEIIRQLEQDYGLEQVAKSWQTFKNQQRNFQPTLELSSHQKLAAEIEQASLGQPTMPEFFQRLANYQIQAELNFTRTGKPYGISYQTAFGEKVSGNALGKAYSFCGLQKYLKVNYDPAKDHLKLVEVIQNAQQPVSRSSTVELTEGLSREEGNLRSPTINLEDRQLSYEGCPPLQTKCVINKTEKIDGSEDSSEVQYYPKLILLDADLSDICTRFFTGIANSPYCSLQELENYQANHDWLTPAIFINEWTPDDEIKANCYFYTEQTPLVMRDFLMEHIATLASDGQSLIEQNKRIYINTQGAAHTSKHGVPCIAKEIQERLPHLKVLDINRQTLGFSDHAINSSENLDLNSIIKNYDIIVASPSLETGYSIDDLPASQFDSVWCFAPGVDSPKNALQGIERVRQRCDRHVWAAQRGMGECGKTDSHQLIKELLDRQSAHKEYLRSIICSDSLMTSIIPLKTWADLQARVNAEREVYRAYIQLELSKYYNPIELDPIGNKDYLKALREKNKKLVEQCTEDEVKRHWEARDLTPEEFAELKTRTLLTAADTYAVQKHEIFGRYGLISEEIIKADIEGMYPAMRTLYNITDGFEFIEGRDCPRGTSVANRAEALENVQYDKRLGKKTVFLPDFAKGSDRTCKAKLLRDVNLLGLVEDLKDRIFSSKTDALQNFLAHCKHYAPEFERHLHIDVIKGEKSPIVLLRQLLELIGYSTIQIARTKKHRFFVLHSSLPSNMNEIFALWLTRDQERVARELAQVEADRSWQWQKEDEHAEVTKTYINNIEDVVTTEVVTAAMDQDWLSNDKDGVTSSYINNIEDVVTAETVTPAMDQDWLNNDKDGVTKTYINNIEDVVTPEVVTAEAVIQVDESIRTYDPAFSAYNYDANEPHLWQRRLNRAQLLGDEVMRKVYQCLPSQILNTVWSSLTATIQREYYRVFGQAIS